MAEPAAIEEQHKAPTSPATNPVVSVLSKMLEKSGAQPQAAEPVVIANPNAKNFAFYLDFMVGDELPRCELQVDASSKVETALVQALERFQTVLMQKGYEMDTGLQNYTLRLAKKNGKPKTDMPSIDLKQKFTEIKVSASSIQIKNPECIRAQAPIDKTLSYNSISSQIMNEPRPKSQELMTEQQILRGQKNTNCMFSFC